MYEWKKSLKKGIVGVIYLLICGLMYAITDKPQVAILVPILMVAQNWAKHYLGWSWL